MPEEKDIPNIDWDQILEADLPQLRAMVGAKVDGPHRVDDILQEVALVVKAKPENRPTDRTKVLPWLRAIALRKVQDLWRGIYRERKKTDSKDSATCELSPYPSPAEWVMQAEQASHVRQVMQELDNEDQRLLKMKYEDGMRYRDIAHSLGISEKSVEYRLAAARDRFQLAFQEYKT